MKRLGHFVPQSSHIRGRSDKIRNLKHVAAGSQRRTYTIGGVLNRSATLRMIAETSRCRDICLRIRLNPANVIAGHEDREVFVERR